MKRRTSSTEGRNTAYINKKVLRWAINRAASADLDTKEAEQFSYADKYPTIRQAQKIAKRLSIPYGYLFLSSIPENKLPIPDLRTQDGKAPENPGLNLRDQIEWIMEKQRWFAHWRRKEGGEALPFVASQNMEGGITPMAKAMERVLGLTAIRKEAKNWGDYMTRLVRHAEEKNILVMRSGVVAMNTYRPLDVNEFQGFAIADPMAPLIFINSRDYMAAQIFTYAHELAHIWLGKSGITRSDEEGTEDKPWIETFCNAVAAELLVPQAQFNDAWIKDKPAQEQIDKLVRTFWVSSIVILRRALETKRISKDQFFAQLKTEKDKIIEDKEKKKKKSSGGDGIKTIISRLSPLLVRTAVTDAMEGRTGFSEALDVLDTKATTLNKLAHKLELL